MADVSVFLVMMNSSIPNTRDNIDDYVIGLLSRSYSEAWSGLTYNLGNSLTPLASSYSPSLPSLQAQVDLKRMYIWLSIQLLVTLSGVLFLFVQSMSEYRLLGSTTLAALELDATEAMTNDGCDQLSAGGLLKLKPQDGRLKIVIEMGGNEAGEGRYVGLLLLGTGTESDYRI